MSIQLTESEWAKSARGALKDWRDISRLNRNPLTKMSIVSRQLEASPYVDDPHGKALALREIMRNAIDTLRVEGEDPPDLNDPRWLNDAWRPYNILTLLQRHKTTTVSEMIALYGGNYYKVQAKAVEMLVEVLRGWEGIPVEAASPIALAYPSGAVKLADRFYVERFADFKLNNALDIPGGETVTIRGSRQVGKTSLLIRGMHEAKQRLNAKIVYFDLQNAGGEALESLDKFLRMLADWVFDELELDLEIVQNAWKSHLPASRKLTKLLERHVLSDTNVPVLLAMDEIDRLQVTDFRSDFFGLVRSWHNMRASRPHWDKLSVIMAISTEPYLLIADLNQSPFNVGEILYLQDFDKKQVADLNLRYETPLTDAELPELMELLNGHPYLTRAAFYTMVIEKQAWREFVQTAASDHGPFHQHLQHQYRLLIHDPALQKAMSRVVHGMHCTDEQAVFRLLKAGLITQEEDHYICRCNLYQHYFWDKL